MVALPRDTIARQRGDKIESGTGKAHTPLGENISIFEDVVNDHTVGDETGHQAGLDHPDDGIMSGSKLTIGNVIKMFKSKANYNQGFATNTEWLKLKQQDKRQIVVFLILSIISVDNLVAQKVDTIQILFVGYFSKPMHYQLTLPDTIRYIETSKGFYGDVFRIKTPENIEEDEPIRILLYHKKKCGIFSTSVENEYLNVRYREGYKFLVLFNDRHYGNHSYFNYYWEKEITEEDILLPELYDYYLLLNPPPKLKN